MELTPLAIGLLVSFAFLITALITIIIKFANYKDEKEKIIKEKDIILSDFAFGRENLIKENQKLKGDLIKKDEAIADQEHKIKAQKEFLDDYSSETLGAFKLVEVLKEENKFLIEHGPKVLKLNVAAKLYDKLVDGTEIAVPLANKDYWKKQLLDSDGVFKEYHLAEVSNGRREGYQTAKFIVSYVELAQRERNNDDSKFFFVYLGERLN